MEKRESESGDCARTLIYRSQHCHVLAFDVLLQDSTGI